MLDVSLLLSAVSANASCGEDLEYDADFLQLERDALGKPERTMGNAIQPAEPPQWQHIQQSSITLLQRSKDLRIAHFLLQSSLALDGFRGLAITLAFINDLLGQYWPTLYPQLDAEDNNDPTARINALSGIACDTNLRLLRESLLIRSRTFGPISLRAALHASGLQTFSDERLTSDELNGAMRESDPEQLSALRLSLEETHSVADAIEHYVSSQVGSTQGVDLSALKQLLRQAVNILNGHAADEVSTDFLVVEASHSLPTAQTGALIARPLSAITHRDDVIKSLDSILDYYARHEPSSPLPVLLNRAKNLAHADFATIVRNLIPDGLNQFENLRGPDAG